MFNLLNHFGNVPSRIWNPIAAKFRQVSAVSAVCLLIGVQQCQQPGIQASPGQCDPTCNCIVTDDAIIPCGG